MVKFCPYLWKCVDNKKLSPFKLCCRRYEVIFSDGLRQGHGFDTPHEVGVAVEDSQNVHWFHIATDDDFLLECLWGNANDRQRSGFS